MTAKLELPEHEIVTRWLSAGETTESLASGFSCSKATILRVLRNELGREQVALIARSRYGSPGTQSPTESDKAYAAGLFDGEGSINIDKPRTNKGYSLKVSVAQITPQAPAWLKTRWGGSTREYATRKGKPLYTWAAVSMCASGFLSDIAPYLLIKQNQALLAIEFQSLRHNGRKLSVENIRMDSEYRERLLSMR